MVLLLRVEQTRRWLSSIEKLEDLEGGKVDVVCSEEAAAAAAGCAW